MRPKHEMSMAEAVWTLIEYGTVFILLVAFFIGA